MKNTDLETRLKPILGHGWQRKLADALYNGQVRTVRRQVAGEVEVPPYVEAAIELLETCVANGVQPPVRWQLSRELAPAFKLMSTLELAKAQGLDVGHKKSRKKR